MNEVETTPSRWKKPVIGAGITTLVIVCGVVAGLSRTDLGQAASEYEKNKSDARQEGLYFTTEQVEARYAIPDSDNGASLIAKILPGIREIKLDKPKNLTESTIKSHQATLDQAIAIIGVASHRKTLMFRRDFSNPAGTLFPEYSDVKQWVTLLVKMGHFAVEKGDYALAQKYWELASYLAIQIDKEGFLIGSLVRIACASIIEKELQEGIAVQGKNPAMIKTIEAIVTKLDQPYDLKESLKIEHWFGVTGAEMIMKNPSLMQSMTGASISNELRLGPYLPRFKVANLSRIHRFYADAITSIPSDPYDLTGIQRAYFDLDKSMTKTGLSYTMIGILGPIFSEVGKAFSKEIAQRNALKQAIEILKTGANPAAGLPLKGRFIQDIDGKPLRIKKTSSGWIVYSVWGDKVDNGGVQGKLGKGDYVVQLPR